MTSIVAAVDISGDQDVGNKFMGIVIGTREKIDSIVRELGSSSIHMSRIKNKDTQNTQDHCQASWTHVCQVA